MIDKIFQNVDRIIIYDMNNISFDSFLFVIKESRAKKIEIRNIYLEDEEMLDQYKIQYGIYRWNLDYKQEEFDKGIFLTRF